MKLRLVDLLACPYDKHWPLELYIFEEKEVSPSEKYRLPLPNKHSGVICEFYCKYKDYYLVTRDEDGKETPKPIAEVREHVSLEDCEKCHHREIVNGLLVCPSCHRYYPILDEIPELLPDDIRMKELPREEEFASKFSSYFAQFQLEGVRDQTLDRLKQLKEESGKKEK